MKIIQISVINSVKMTLKRIDIRAQDRFLKLVLLTTIQKYQSSEIENKHNR